MPYAVWIELVDPDPDSSDEMTRAQRPQRILELIRTGEDAEPPFDDEDPIVVMDIRVLAHPGGARIGLAVNTDELEISLGIGMDVARHLAGSPELFTWDLEAVRAEKLSAPREPGVWLPSFQEPGARFPLAEYLPPELQELSAQYLLAAAAADLDDPTGRDRGAIDAAEVVAGAVEHPWGRELTGVLGGLLVAACRAEATSGTHHPLIGRGGGDPELAQALLDAVREDQAVPSADDEEDDAMRGHMLVEDFMEAHDLRWNRVDDTLDPEADEERSQRRLRLLLWAGLRALATMGKDTLGGAESPWVWLDELGSDAIDEVVSLFVERDIEEFVEDAEEAEDALSSAASAHLLMRLALLHPVLLDTKEAAMHMADPGVTVEPLQHLGFHALLSVGAPTIEQVAQTAATPVAQAAQVVLPPLRALNSEDGDPYDDLYRSIDELLPAATSPGHTRVFLDLISTAVAADDGRAAHIARTLLTTPAQLAAVVADLSGGTRIEHRLALRILAKAAAIHPTVAGSIAADLPALRSHDPRDEPALRNEATAWWLNTVQAFHRLRRSGLLDPGALDCPEPGNELLRRLGGTSDLTEAGSLLEDLTTPTAVVAVVQAASTLALAAQQPHLVTAILLSTA